MQRLYHIQSFEQKGITLLWADCRNKQRHTARWTFPSKDNNFTPQPTVTTWKQEVSEQCETNPPLDTCT